METTTQKRSKGRPKGSKSFTPMTLAALEKIYHRDEPINVSTIQLRTKTSQPQVSSAPSSKDGPDNEF